MKKVDVTKKSNIKCEHCQHYHPRDGKIHNDWHCGLTGEAKNYWNRCKNFEWKKEIVDE